MAFIFMFVDGIGLGKPGPHNPLANKDADYSFTDLITKGQPFTQDISTVEDSDHLFIPVDACLDVEGLPQSGTGQATLFSGVNASKLLGRHFGPYPHSKIKTLLIEKSLFSRLKDGGKKPYFMNAFPEIFFTRARQRNRWSCCTLMTRSADVPLNSLADVLDRTAITADIIQDGWREHLNLDVPVIAPQEAAGRVIKMSRQYDLILVEFYLTDKAGHSQDGEYTKQILTRLDGFLTELIMNKDRNDTFLLTSDHGNIEDLSIKTHTRNNVPLFVSGPAVPWFRGVRSILDVTPAILKTLLDKGYPGVC